MKLFHANIGGVIVPLPVKIFHGAKHPITTVYEHFRGRDRE